MSEISKERLRFWNERACLGEAAGSGDTNLKKIEISALIEHTPIAGSFLDAGCGNGITMIEMAKAKKDISLTGFDYSSEMVRHAIQLIKSEGLCSRIKVSHGNLQELDKLPCLEAIDKFDCIYTERSLINLDSYAAQHKVILTLWERVADGGALVLCESFHEGLEEINSYRESVSLSPISPPWHNQYLRLSKLASVQEFGLPRPRVIEFSGAYYFASRVINASIASKEGAEPNYSSPINLVTLPMKALPVCGQSKLLIFEKR